MTEHTQTSMAPYSPHEPSPLAISRQEGDETPDVDSIKTVWDEAYDQVGKQSKTILNMYEDIVAYDLRHLHGQTHRPVSLAKNAGNTVHSLAFQVRRSQMEALLDSWINGSSEDRGGQSGSRDGNSFISSFCREIVMRSRQRMSPAAILPWVAACYASKALRHSSPKIHDAQTNLIHLISRIEWYDRLQKLFTDDEDNDPAYPEFQNRLKDLYATILLYFMKVAISHSPDFSYGPQTATFTDELDLDFVTKAEGALAGFNEEPVDHRLRRLFEAAQVQIEVRNELLDGLRVTDPRPHLKSSDPTQRDVTNGIYRLLQKRKEYTDFVDWEKPECQLLWISGNHGQGKTKLLHGVIESLYKPSNLPGVAFFFFSYASHESDNAASALRNLIWLIIKRCPPLGKHLQDKYSTTERNRLDHPNDFLALSTLFFNIIQDQRFPEMYLIIDSLDECNFDKTKFINLITESTSACSRIKWLVSGMSKPEGPRWQHLALASDIHNSYTVIHNYIKYAVSILARDNSYDKELETLVTERLCRLEIKNYLWVEIVCEVLKSKKVWRVEQFVAQVETRRDLPGLYSLLHEIINSQKMENPFCIDVLLTMGAVYHSLGFDELKELTNWPPWIDMKTILQQCFGFLQLQGNTVLFRHESARDYAKRCILEPNEMSKVHVRLIVLCLKFLGDRLSNDHTVLPDGARDQQAVLTTIAGSYASLNWMKHLVQVTDVAQNTEVRKAVLSFFERNLLHWVDALTQGDKIYLVVSRLREAEMQLRRMKGNNNDLANAIQDACLFLRLHISTDDSNNLRASNTAIFCPEESLVKRSWDPTVHPWLSKQPQMDQTWSPNFTTFRGHKDWVRSISISSDGRLLASGSDDGTVRIWDTEAETTQHVFTPRKNTFSYVTLVALAGRIVAAGPDDLPVILWDTLTGRKVAELPTYTVGADALCLSHDGGKVAVATDRRVYIWNIVGVLGGSQPQEPIAYPIVARDLVFSQDDELLVTSDDAIELCDSNSFQVRWKFTNDEKEFICATLGPCGISGRRLLASGSRKGTICIWEIDADIKRPGNTLTVASMPTLSLRCKSESHIKCLAFSPDGSRLASSSFNGIDIWESSTTRHLNTLQAQRLGSNVIIFDPLGGDYLISSARDNGVHFWYVNDKHGQASSSKEFVEGCSIDGLALHPDGKMLAAARSDYTVFLWDLQSGTVGSPNMNFDHGNDLRSLAFSPNKGDKLLSASDDRTAQVCDVATGKQLYVFRGHGDWIRCAAWSPDGGYVATASDDGSIRFWEIGNQAEPDPIATLPEAHGGFYVIAVAFSPNGKYVISGGSDDNLIIWEKSTEGSWQHKHEPLTGHTGKVACVLVTPDSKYVLSASIDRTLRGWDIESGREISQTKIDWVDFKMWWDLSAVPQGETPNHVVTPQGAWLHHLPAVSNNQTISQWHIRCDNDTDQWWITCNNKDTILIPRDYRPRSSLVIGSKVIIGSVLERLYVLECKDSIEIS
ncbi:hypothetical protein F4859DRAFT_528837 [Xylaria cf. heliscus]|nr:hypothetical protein F4859DRAFT_528837 [Xylaria cf. heliscus]